MYQSKSKIQKVDGTKPTEIEEDVGKSLQQLQMSKDELKEHMVQITVTNVDLVEYKQRDGSLSKALHVKIPFRCTPAYSKIQNQVVEHLEDKFKWPVIITANRTIVSKRGKFQPEGLTLQWLFTRFDRLIHPIFSQASRHPDET